MKQTYNYLYMTLIFVYILIRLLSFFCYLDREKLLEELHSLPLTADTLRVTSRRTQLESRLVEVEDAIEIFSRPKVFVKIDE